MGITQDPLANAIALRKVADSLKNSVMASFQWAIGLMGWEPYFKIVESSGEITYKPTGQQILMKGLDDPQKLKSIRAKVGYFKYLWFEEGAEYSSIEEIESVEQSVLRGGEKFREFVTYNPPVEPKAWINEEARRQKANRLVHESNFTQVPQHWLGPKFLADAADMLRDKPDKYAHIYMGREIGRSDAIIFSGCYRVESFEVKWQDKSALNNWVEGWFLDGEPVDGPYFGADWGFSQDPTTLVKCWLKGKQLLIEYEKFGVGVKLDDTPALFDLVPDSRRHKIRADCARPETIVHIKDRGFKIEGVEKWKGSVEDGITWLQSKHIVIHPRCVNMQDEAIKYSYKIDRITREVTSDIVDAHNHGWDAVRYAFNPMIQPKPKGFFG
jgi:phage terminase large subunit